MRPFLRISVLATSAVLVLGLVAVPGSAGRPSAKWTFAIYMCSDNDLDYYGELNIKWLMSVGSTASVNFVVLWDPSTGPAHMYRIEKESMAKIRGFEYSGVEVNMGDPAVLKAFVKYLNSNFKASNVLVDLWDHGDDFRGICFDYDTGTGNLDYLTHQEIGDALSGQKLAILAADGCGIGVVEAAYEYVVRGVAAPWFVASENYVPLEGFPYGVIAKDLVSDPDMTPQQLSKVIVDRYAAYYQKGWLTVLAAIRLPEIRIVADELWDVTSILASGMKSYRGLVASGRGQATMGWSQYGWEGYVDFPTVFEVICAGAPSGSELRLQTGELLRAIESAVPYVGCGSPCHVWDPEGLSIFFPCAEGSYKHNTWWRGSLYPTMQFAQDGWIKFLEAYYGK